MAAGGSANQRQQGLQQAASVLFAQVSLALTLALMLLGYWLFRSMLSRMSELMLSMSRALAAVARPPGTPVADAVVVAPPSSDAREVVGLGSIWEIGEM